MPIISESGKIAENLYLVDLLQFGMPKITAAFYFWDGRDCVLFDVGTSNNVLHFLRVLKQNQIPLEKVRGIVLSHYHFDHGGGATKIWKKIVRKNPEFKIYIPLDMHDKLQDAKQHLVGAKTTFGDFIGKMDPAPENAFKLIEKDVTIPFELNNGYEIRLISTPGHSPDHCAPTLYKDGVPIFIFAGESCGCIFHSSKILSLPTSMPPNFNYTQYMVSFAKIDKMGVDLIGFCHFGAISGEDDVRTFFDDHKKWMEGYHQEIIRIFSENPSTRYLIENTMQYWDGRFDPAIINSGVGVGFFERLRLALIYGQLVDFGYRKSKYEKQQN